MAHFLLVNLGDNLADFRRGLRVEIRLSNILQEKIQSYNNVCITEVFFDKPDFEEPFLAYTDHGTNGTLHSFNEGLGLLAVGRLKDGRCKTQPYALPFNATRADALNIAFLNFDLTQIDRNRIGDPKNSYCIVKFF